MGRIFVVLMVFVWVACDAHAAGDAEVSKAIERMQAYLLSQQDPLTGGWEDNYANHSRHRGGETALVTFALLRSGLSAQEPELQKAIKYLNSVTMNGTYAVSLRAHCWAALSNDYRGLLTSDARWLASAQVQGLFDYGPRTGPQYDHSVTQYGLLGLWEAAKRRGPQSRGVWLHASKHFINLQNPDGGWGYKGGGGSSRSMTAAGLTALLIAQEILYLDRNKPEPNLSTAVERATNWLDKEARENGFNRATREMYYLVSLERATLASGIKSLGGRDWFKEAGEAVIRDEGGAGVIGGSYVDTAFALIFLSKGRTPVWINKLRIPGGVWNNRPNDLNMMTRELSDLVEQDLNWQVVDIGSDPVGWLNAPVAYLASDEPIEISKAAEESLRIYLSLGGVLVAAPEVSSQAFEQSLRDLAAKLYPGLSFERAGEDHALMRLVYPVDLPEERRPWVLSNGVRDLIILAPSDWGMALQSGRNATHTGAKKIMANLHALVTGRGQSEGSTEPVIVSLNDSPYRGMLRVVRGVSAEDEVVEPLAWLPLVNRLYNDTGIELTGGAELIARVGELDAPLVYLGGSSSKRLSPDEVRGVVKYIRGGGTVFVENIGGRGTYADEVLRQLEAVFSEQAVPLDQNHPILTGEGYHGGTDQSSIVYRRYSTLNRGLVDTPRLEGITIDGRVAVIASREDISMGVLGARWWGIDGYETESARGLLTNMLLYVADTKNQAPGEAEMNGASSDLMP